jgi:hypothetical protein
MVNGFSAVPKSAAKTAQESAIKNKHALLSIFILLILYKVNVIKKGLISKDKALK